MTDILVRKIILKIESRPNQLVCIGTLDHSCAYSIADAQQADNPLVYLSPGFYNLTGYNEADKLLGRNCRFLQYPYGARESKHESNPMGSKNLARYMASALNSFRECQATIVNFHKSGRQFMNMVTIIPICLDVPDKITHFVGVQVDVERRNRVIAADVLTSNLQMSNYTRYQQPCARASVYEPRFGSPRQHGSARIEDGLTAAANHHFHDYQEALLRRSIPFSHQQLHKVHSGRPIHATMNKHMPSPYSRPTVNRLASSPAHCRETFQYTSCEMASALEYLQNNSHRNSVSTTYLPGVNGTEGSAMIPSPPNSIDKQPNYYSSYSVSPRKELPKPLFQLGPKEPQFETARGVLSLNPDILMIVSSRGLVLYVTEQSFENIFATPVTKIIGASLSDIFDMGDTSSLLRELKSSTTDAKISRSMRTNPGSGNIVSVMVIGHKYQMTTQKKAKCYVLSIRPYKEKELSQTFLEEANMNKSMLLKVTRKGIVCRIFDTVVNQDIPVKFCDAIIDHVILAQREEMARLLTLPCEDKEFFRARVSFTTSSGTVNRFVTFAGASGYIYLSISATTHTASDVVVPNQTVLQFELTKRLLENQKLTGLLRQMGGLVGPNKSAQLY